ncbi:MAG: Hint domain-containing protein, partial [Planctomycetia bacterium]
YATAASAAEATKAKVLADAGAAYAAWIFYADANYARALAPLEAAYVKAVNEAAQPLLEAGVKYAAANRVAEREANVARIEKTLPESYANREGPSTTYSWLAGAITGFGDSSRDVDAFDTVLRVGGMIAWGTAAVAGTAAAVLAAPCTAIAVGLYALEAYSWVETGVDVAQLVYDEDLTEEERTSLYVNIGLQVATAGLARMARRVSPFCFPADTPVHTERGLVPIGEVVAGDKVWGYDFAAGRWTLAEVAARHDRDYRGALYTLTAETGETVRTTTGHPFWVTAGDDLPARPACEQLEPREDEGKELPGRWVNSHDLKPGDTIVLRTAAAPVRLADVTHEHAKLPVCNLTVPSRPNYAVATGGFLVHNMCAVNNSQGGLTPNSMFRDALQIHKGTGQLTNAGRALTKHPEMLGLTKDTLRKVVGSDPAVNKAAHEVLKNIMRNGSATTSSHSRYGVITAFKLLNGLGARFETATNRFIGFIS